MTGLTTTNTTAMAIPKEWQGFTEEEANGGMAPVQESYLKSYRYFLSRPSMKAKFQIVDNETDKVVWEGAKIEGAVIYYGHEVVRLKKGHVGSPDKSEADFTDEENEILAVTYDPANSKGNFELNGYGKYLTKEYADLKGKLTRLYLVMMLPGKEYNTGLNLVAASFSVTTIKSFNSLRKAIKTYGAIPLPFFETEIFFSDAVSKSEQEYERIDFALRKDENELPIPKFKSPDAYRESKNGLGLLNAIIDTHKGAVQNAERSGFGSGIAEADVTVPAYSVEDDIKDTFKGKEVADPLASKEDKGPW